MNYPKTFTEELSILKPEEVAGTPGAESLHELSHRGYVVTVGARRQDAPALAEIAKEPGVREFCPRDERERMGDADGTMLGSHLGKKGGRGMFILRHVASGKVAADGWTGEETCDELPGALTTFALRISKAFGGQGLGVLFTNAIVDGSVARFGARRMGLESWFDNIAAIMTYGKSGATFVAAKDDKRETLQTGPGIVNGWRPATRGFAAFGRTFDEDPEGLLVPSDELVQPDQTLWASNDAEVTRLLRAGAHIVGLQNGVSPAAEDHPFAFDHKRQDTLVILAT